MDWKNVRIYKLSFGISIGFILLACSCGGLSLLGGGDSPVVATDLSGSQFSKITFCEDVTIDGSCIKPGEEFDEGVSSVSALFTYQGMQPGQSWGQLWLRDGEVDVDMRELTWVEEVQGWTAYEYYEEYALPAGRYTLTLFIDEKSIQSASFTVLESGGQSEDMVGPALGQIEFSSSMSEDFIPYGLADQFEYGIRKIYGVFPFTNMQDGQAWACKWSHEGVELVYVDFAWDMGEAGSTYCSYENAESTELESGEYTISLYLDEQVARSANIAVLPPDYERDEIPLAVPEDVISPELMPAWEMLNSISDENLHYFSQIPLIYHVDISIDDKMTWYGASYRVENCLAEPRIPGRITFQRQNYDDSTWEEVAALMAHESVHAAQHMDKGQCGCSIYNEVQAYAAQVLTLQELGRMDLIEKYWRFAYDSDGFYRQDLLWEWVDEQYDCRDYFPDDAP